MPYGQALYIFPLIIMFFPLSKFPQDPYTVNARRNRSILRSYASPQSDQSWSLPLCIVSKFGTISMKTDQNARMHNTLSDLSTWRLSWEQTEMILKNYGKENNRGSDSVMLYHITIASKHKRGKLRLVGASVRHIRVSATRRNNGCCASGNFLPVRRLFKVFITLCHEVILAC